ncbi:MAG: hypothetical protein NXI31_11710 [bacterium]|nr:hypothetical protein [bacterium]
MSTLNPPTFAPDYVHYTDPAFCREFFADMRGRSAFQERCPEGLLRLRYDPVEFDFRSPVLARLRDAGLFEDVRNGESMLEPSNGDGLLENLHEHVAEAHQRMDESQQSAAARALYELPAGCYELHARFHEEVVAPALGLGPLHHQNVPTFRVFFPDAPGYPGRTSFHNDIMIGHNPREVNVFVPLVECRGTRSLLMASLADSLDLLGDYAADLARFGRDTQLDEDTIARCEAICRPLEVGVGDLVVFDSRCLHAGPHNTTPLTRVTFDSRVLPARNIAGQQNRYIGRGRRRARFEPGQYFSAATVG